MENSVSSYAMASAPAVADDTMNERSAAAGGADTGTAVLTSGELESAGESAHAAESSKIIYTANLTLESKDYDAARAALDAALAEAGGYSRILYLDDHAPDAAGKLADYLDPTIRERCTAAFVGLGNNELRLQWLQKLVAAGYQTPVFEHPAAEVCSSAALGAGTVVLPFAFVGAGTKVGAGCIINAGAIVDHNAVLEDGVHAAPRATIKAGATVERCMKVDSGEIIRSPWEK